MKNIILFLRCEYGKTCSLLVQLFDQAAQSYQEMISNMSTSKIELTIQEGRLTWLVIIAIFKNVLLLTLLKLFVTFFRLVYIIGAAVGGRVSFNSNDEHDAMDGELVCRVLQLMNLTDARYVMFYTGNEYF